jgi:hypothetical protein
LKDYGPDHRLICIIHVIRGQRAGIETRRTEIWVYETIHSDVINSISDHLQTSRLGWPPGPPLNRVMPMNLATATAVIPDSRTAQQHAKLLACARIGKAVQLFARLCGGRPWFC